MKFKVGDYIVHGSNPKEHIKGPVLQIYNNQYRIDNQKLGVGVDIRGIPYSAIDPYFILDEPTIIDRVLGKYLPEDNESNDNSQ